MKCKSYDGESCFFPQIEGGSNPLLVYLHLTKWKDLHSYRTLGYFTMRLVDKQNQVLVEELFSWLAEWLMHEGGSQPESMQMHVWSPKTLRNKDLLNFCSLCVQYLVYWVFRADGDKKHPHPAGEKNLRDFWLASWHKEAKILWHPLPLARLIGWKTKESLCAGHVKDRNWALVYWEQVRFE